MTRRLLPSRLALAAVAACSGGDPIAPSHCTESRIPAPDPAGVAAWVPTGRYAIRSPSTLDGGLEPCLFHDAEKTVLSCSSWRTGVGSTQGPLDGPWNEYVLRFRPSPTLEPAGAVLRLGDHFEIESIVLRRQRIRPEPEQLTFTATRPVAGTFALTIERVASNTLSIHRRPLDVQLMQARRSFCRGAVAVGFRTRLGHPDTFARGQ